jgi:hypothetical protein
LNRLTLIFSVFVFIFVSFVRAESSTKDKPKEKLLVSVTIPETSETEFQELKNHQTGLVKVFLSSLGDMVDSYMISLVDLTGGSKTVNLLTDSDGIVTFKKVPAGNYAVHINRKAATEDQEHGTVKISDIIIKAYP